MKQQQQQATAADLRALADEVRDLRTVCNEVQSFDKPVRLSMDQRKARARERHQRALDAGEELARLALGGAC